MTSAGHDSDVSGRQLGKLRNILLVAFGSLLGLMAVAGVNALLSLRQLDSIERRVNQQYSAHSQALTTILISVHIYHDQMERFLMDEKGGENRGEAADVQKRGVEVLSALQMYPADADPEEKAFLADIRQKFQEQESSFAELSVSHRGERPDERQQNIREQMMLRRAYILRVSRNVSTWNNRKLGETTQSLAASFANAQTRLVTIVFLLLLAGLLLSIVGGFYILRLEKQGRRRYEALIESRSELEALSGRLVDAQEEERRAISRELHDEVGQTLGALACRAGQLSKVRAGRGRPVTTADRTPEVGCGGGGKDRSAIWRCCFGRLCWTIWDWCQR